MDYKEKYEQALKRARNSYKAASRVHSRTKVSIETFKNTLIDIFPELKEKESENERIRKGLIKSVSRIIEGHKLFDTDVTREEAIAWLEKQGEQNSVFTMPPFKAENFYVSKVDGKIHDMTYNPSDKVEQKINVELLISVLRKHLYTCIDKITSTEIIDKIKTDLNID